MSVGFKFQKPPILLIPTKSPKKIELRRLGEIQNQRLLRRKSKILRKTMKTTEILTPKSSVNSTTTTDNNPSEKRDSFYFLGCRKDANCNCDICLASINATLDLFPPSMRTTLTKVSVSRPAIPRSPVSFNPSSADISTPKLTARRRPVSVSPPLNSTARINFQEKVKRRKRGFGIGVLAAKIFLGLAFVFSVEFGFSWMISRVLQCRLSPGAVRNLGEKSREFEFLNERFLFLKEALEGFVGKEVASCGSDSDWKISQDGLLLNSRCVLYESMTEEVSIWGWPLQTAGLLTAEYASRSFSIISGRVTEWSNGEAEYSVKKTNSSWVQEKWSSSVVQFDPNTWILEYRQSFLMENSRLISGIAEFLKFRLAREFGKLKKEFWLVSAFGTQHLDFAGRRLPPPT